MSRTNWTYPRRSERRVEAGIRQEYYDSLSNEQKIAQCHARRGESAKELVRLGA